MHTKPSVNAAEQSGQGALQLRGSTGDSPVPSGDPPDGTRDAPLNIAQVHRPRGRPYVAVGGSPTGTGESPVLPIFEWSAERRAAFPGCRFTALSSAVSAGPRNTGLESPVNRQARKPALRQRGITIIEVVVIIVGLMMLALLVLAPTNPSHAKARAPRINCSNNLHQIGLAEQTWALDNNDKFPNEVSVTNHGAREFALAGNVAQAFAVMSNELNTPKILVCPADSKRKEATVFNGSLTNINVSYFLSIDANDSLPNMFLAGDRNIMTNGVELTSGVHLLRTNTPVSWTDVIHLKNGNVLLVDGSAQQWSSMALRAGLGQSGATNRIAVP